MGHLMYWTSLLTAFSCLPGGVYAVAGLHRAESSRAARMAAGWSLIAR